MSTFKIIFKIIDVIMVSYLIFYCISSLINIFTGGGVVDEKMDFVLSFLLLCELAKRD